MPAADALNTPIAIGDVKSLQSLGLKPVKLSDERIANFQKILEKQYERPVNLADHPSQKPYAEVKVDGKVVATLYNGGSAQTSNATYARVKNLPSMGEDCRLTGPELAQLRAEEIAKAMGGTIVKASTAITQSAWLTAPLITFEIDYAAMARDKAEAQKRTDAAQSLLQAQLSAQAEASDNATSAS